MPPSIPTEIWELIFRLATLDHESMTPSLHHLYYHDLCRDKDEKSTHRDSISAIATKWSISRVSREWWAIVQPMLYEHIALSDFDTLGALVDSMEQPVYTGRSRGECVYRLDIVACNNHHEDTDEILHLLHGIHQLLSLLPRLRSLLFRNSFHMDGSVFLENQPFFFHSASPTLRSITWLDEDPNPGLMKVPSTLWAAFLDAHHDLESIQPPKLILDDHPRFTGEPLPLVSRPKTKVKQLLLRISCLASPDPIFLPGPNAERTTGAPSSSPSKKMPSKKEDLYPNLRHVTFKFPVIGCIDMEMLGEILPTPTLFKFHGHKLTSIDCVYHNKLDKAHFASFLDESDASPQLQFFPMIARHCPNLEELGLYFNWAPGTSFDIPYLPGVKKLKMRRMTTTLDVGAYRTMLNFLAIRVRGSLPKLQEVVFASEKDVANIRNHREILKVELRRLDDLTKMYDHDGGGLALVDGEGRPLEGVL